MASYDVLIWNTAPEDLEDPFRMHEIDMEHIDLTYRQAKKIFDKTKKFNYKVIMEYESNDPDSSGEEIEDEMNPKFINRL